MPLAFQNFNLPGKVPCPQCGRLMENIAGSKRLSRCSCGYYEGCC